MPSVFIEYGLVALAGGLIGSAITEAVISKHVDSWKEKAENFYFSNRKYVREIEKLNSALSIAKTAISARLASARAKKEKVSDLKAALEGMEIKPEPQWTYSPPADPKPSFMAYLISAGYAVLLLGSVLAWFWII